MIQKNKVRKDEIEKHISDIIDAIEIVEDNFPENFKDFSVLGLKKDGIYKKVEFAIENVIDICNIINSDLRLGIPDIEEGIFLNLENKKIFDKKIINIIRNMKRFRNVLVHRYGNIDDKLAYEEIKKGFEDFEIVINEFEMFLKKY